MEITKRIYHDWMKDIQEKKIQAILRIFHPEHRIRDIGCGPGFLEKYLEGVYAVDIDLENLKRASGFKILADGNCLPFKPGSFRTIFCIDAIHLLKKNIKIKNLLSKDGRIVVSMFCNKYNLRERIKRLREIFKDWNIEKEFFVDGIEMDAILICNIR